jgi:hypothetical protein
VLSEAHCRAGRTGEARRIAEETLTITSAGGYGTYAVLAHMALARALLAEEGHLSAADIERTLAEANRLIEAHDIGGFRPQLRELEATLARREGRDDEAARLLAEALRLYREIGATGHAARLEAASGPASRG